MAMVFPGMDPYLENPQVFPGIHGPMSVYLRDQLTPLIRPRYVASVGDRVYVAGPESRPITPDVWLRRTTPHVSGGITAATPSALDEPAVVEVPDLEIHEPYIEILDRESGMRVVTVELVSPSNKYAGTGRERYIAKQQEILQRGKRRKTGKRSLPRMALFLDT